MNEFKYFCQQNKALILVVLGLVISLGVTGYLIFNKLTLEKQLQQQTVEIKGTTEKIVILNKTIAAIEKKQSAAAGDVLTLQAENTTLKSDVEAFAKQAATCDKLKKQLRIK